MSIRMLRAPLIVVIALLVGGASAFGMPYVPHTAPSVTITSKPTAWSNVAGPTFKWSKSGTISSTTCQIDGGSFTACTTSKTYSGLAAGSHCLPGHDARLRSLGVCAGDMNAFWKQAPTHQFVHRRVS